MGGMSQNEQRDSARENVIASTLVPRDEGDRLALWCEGARHDDVCKIKGSVWGAISVCYLLIAYS